MVDHTDSTVTVLNGTCSLTPPVWWITGSLIAEVMRGAFDTHDMVDSTGRTKVEETCNTPGMVDLTDSTADVVDQTDSTEVNGTCNFNLEFEFEDDDTPEPPVYDTSSVCECSWSHIRGRDSKSVRFSSRSDTLDGWKTTKSEPQSRSATPDKIRKRRRVHLLRFYPQSEAGKETRSESYVFLHHGNWRQYMKQYRKYHTVGQAGRVNCEDLEWKNLLRHIKLGETFKELLFNSSASLHPPPKFPSMDHWCKEASRAIPLPCQKVSQQREKREKRNLFQSFSLASVKKKPSEFCPQKWTFSWRDGRLPPTKREREALPVSGLERELHAGTITGTNRPTEDHSSPTENFSQRVFASPDWRENQDRKPKGKLKPKKLKSGLLPHIAKTDIHADLEGVGVSLRTEGSDKLTTVLTGVNSFLPKEKVKTPEFTVFQPHELGSLRLGVCTDSPLERTKGKSVDKNDNKKKTERLHFLSSTLIEKESISRKKSKKNKFNLTLEKDEIQSFSVMSYKQLDGGERLQMASVGNSRRSSEQHTTIPRLVRPLSKHTVVWGNKYRTAEQHKLERRLGSPSTEAI